MAYQKYFSIYINWTHKDFTQWDSEYKPFLSMITHTHTVMLLHYSYIDTKLGYRCVTLWSDLHFQKVTTTITLTSLAMCNNPPDLTKQNIKFQNKNLGFTQDAFRLLYLLIMYTCTDVSGRCVASRAVPVF